MLYIFHTSDIPQKVSKLAEAELEAQLVTSQ